MSSDFQVRRQVLGAMAAAALPTLARAADPVFVNAVQADAMSRAAQARITDIGWMRQTPRMVDQGAWDQSSQALTSAQAGELVRLMRRATAMPAAPDTARCQFAPGYQVTFLDARQKVIDAVLVCLNCNVLAIGNQEGADETPVMGSVLRRRPMQPAVPVRYGEAAALRAELLAWLKPHTAK